MPIFRRRKGLMGPIELLQRRGSLWIYRNSHKTLKEKEEGAQNAKDSKNHQKTLEMRLIIMPYLKGFHDLVLRQFG